MEPAPPLDRDRRRVVKTSNPGRLPLSPGGHYFEQPEIKPIPKPGKPHVFRPLALFGLVDSAINGLTAAYLRRCVDADLLPCSLAFRLGNQNASAPTHHDAVERILSYNVRSARGAKWVAECDISAFYDSVSHPIAEYAMRAALDRVRARGEAVDPRASRIFSAYLGCYSFPAAVLGRALRELKRNDPESEFKWNVEALRAFYDDPLAQAIGIPQGGALSNVIANVVLDHADRMVVGESRDPALLYLRYCDDMVLIHTRKRQCTAAFGRYLKALEELRLPAHPPAPIGVYGSAFWGAKSKAPFRWSAAPNDVPWVAFVGYQVHCRNLIRVRPASLAKEIGKQAELAERVILAIGGIKKRKLSRQQVLHRLKQRFIAMSVGRRKIHSDFSRLENFCWAAGFRLLASYQHRGHQLRQLDRAREKQLARVARAMAGANVSTTSTTPVAQRVARFYGRPFSYYGQFHRQAVTRGHELRRNGIRPRPGR